MILQQPISQTPRCFFSDDAVVTKGLRDAGFGWFVVSYRYGGEYLPSTLVSEMTRVFGEPVARSTGLGAWRIPDVDHTPAELEAWKEAHQHGVSTSTRMTPGMGPPPAQPPGG